MNLTKAFAGLLLVTIVALPRVGSAQTSYGVSLEKFTGTWCGWCPYGAWVLDSIEERLGDRAVILAWHFNDQLEIRAHDTLSQAISDGGHPVVSVARRPVTSNTQLRFDEGHPWYTKAIERLAVDPAADLGLDYLEYDPDMRELFFMVRVTPLIAEWPGTGMPMAVAVLTEDDVVLDQSLYDTNGASLPKLLDYPHQNVVRQVAGSVLGDSLGYRFGSGIFSTPYKMRVDPRWNVDRTRLNVLFLVRNEDGSVRGISAMKTRYLSQLGTMGVPREDAPAIAVYPNPASDRVTITLPKSDGGLIEIHNAIGQMVMAREAAGDRIELDVSGLAKGVYSVRADGEVIRFVIR